VYTSASTERKTRGQALQQRARPLDEGQSRTLYDDDVEIATFVDVTASGRAEEDRALAAEPANRLTQRGDPSR
jgi:hypothetical protein